MFRSGLAGAEIADFDESMAREGWSHQLRGKVLADLIAERHGMMLARGLANLTGAPIFTLSRNVRLTDQTATAKQYDHGIVLLHKLVEPAIYPGLPETLMAGGFTTDPIYHRFLPQPSDSDRLLQRDESHMTPEGGRIMSRHIIAAIHRALVRSGEHS